jgi:tRNA pseudouridine55 synthase
MYDMEMLQALAAEGEAALDATLLPAQAALAKWPALCLDETSAHYLRRGQAVQVPRAPTAGWVRLCDEREKLLGVGEVLDDGRVAPRRILQ